MDRFQKYYYSHLEQRRADSLKRYYANQKIKQAQAREWKARNSKKVADYDRQYRKENPERIKKIAKSQYYKHREERLARHKIYYTENREMISLKQRQKSRKWKEEIGWMYSFWKYLGLEQRKNELKKRRNEYTAQWHKQHKEHDREYHQRLWHTTIKHNPTARISNNLRARIRQAIRKRKDRTLQELMGCPINKLINHLEIQFDDEMSWHNYGQGEGRWNIDHRIPCAAYDLIKLEEQKKCFHYSNLQPLWWRINIQKRDKIEI